MERRRKFLQKQRNTTLRELCLWSKAAPSELGRPVICETHPLEALMPPALTSDKKPLRTHSDRRGSQEAG